MTDVILLLEIGQTSRILSHGIFMCNIIYHLSFSTHCSNVISKVKVFKKHVKLQGQGHIVKNVNLVTRNTHIK